MQVLRLRLALTGPNFAQDDKLIYEANFRDRTLARKRNTSRRPTPNDVNLSLEPGIGGHSGALDLLRTVFQRAEFLLTALLG